MPANKSYIVPNDPFLFNTISTSKKKLALSSTRMEKVVSVKYSKKLQKNNDFGHTSCFSTISSMPRSLVYTHFFKRQDEF